MDDRINNTEKDVVEVKVTMKFIGEKLVSIESGQREIQKQMTDMLTLLGNYVTSKEFDARINIVEKAEELNTIFRREAQVTIRLSTLLLRFVGVGGLFSALYGIGHLFLHLF